MERENFSMRSVRGPRNALGLPEPVAFDTGLTNHPVEHIFGRIFGMNDPTMWHTYFNDFDGYTAGDWVIQTTEAGAGDATEAIGDVDGGVLVLTNDAGDNDLDFFQLAKETFKFQLLKPMVFAARFKVLEVLQADVVMGLQIRDTTMLDVTDGIFFQKDDGDALLDFHVEKNNTASDATGIATLVADTFLTVQWAYDGGSRIYYGVNGVTLGYTGITNAVDDEELTVSFGIQNGEAVANVLSVDFIMVSKYRGA